MKSQVGSTFEAVGRSAPEEGAEREAGTRSGILPDYAYYRDLFAGMEMPFAFVDLDQLRRNVRDICGRAADKRIRIASKSVRSAAVMRHILEADPRIQGLMCFSAHEAVDLSRQGFDDLLIAYPAVDPKALRAVAEEVAKGKTLYLMVDCAEHVIRAERAGAALGITLPLCLDLDMSTAFPGLHFGVYRSPIADVRAALALWAEIRKHRHVRLDGLMGYEAQIAGVQDRIPGQFFKNAAIRLLKKWSLPKVVARRQEVIQALRDEGAELVLVNGGGTGSVATTVTESAVTEVTVGSGFYCSHLFDYYHSFDYRPAAGFALEVVREPRPGMITCAGGGYIGSGAPGWEKLPVPWLPHDLRLVPNEGTGEVQTPLILTNQSLTIGDPVFFRHSKAGELCERFTHLKLVSNGRVVEEVTTYRGDGTCYF
ncbi:Amino acid deaminase/aldolase [Sulfidibacter corallicola]|uniref:Amino acid deaminase/aldolase n=1 Tax=Sulfidibacter corallicola TaxID=2818388 RepID=A0A8A4TVL3_SULCO|nr:amino acid deaminase/aldolase [Sulfidibacter corallicola]QTD53996.1 amino acid deaminase/aldolase [Sulfidibacter corallicola]